MADLPPRGVGLDDATTICEIEKNARERVRIALYEYRGHKLIDIRVLIECGDGVRPTPKGVSLSVNRLRELIDALTRAEAEAQAKWGADG